MRGTVGAQDDVVRINLCSPMVLVPCLILDQPPQQLPQLRRVMQCFPHHAYFVRGHHQRLPPEVASMAVVAESNAHVTGGVTFGVLQ